MGMYTEFIFGARLKENTPQDVINTLKYYCGQLEEMVGLAFKTKSGRNPLNNGGSYYFGVINTTPQMLYDSIAKSYIISSRTNLKNYEDEIEDFLKWIKPYCDSGSGSNEMYAIVTYEEQDIPTMYYLRTDED